MVLKIILLISGLLILFFACENISNKEIEISIKGASGKKIFLYKEPFINEKPKKIDSAKVIDYQHRIEFTIRENEEHLYSIRLEESGVNYYLIDDVDKIRIDINHVNGSYNIALSPASNSYKTFTNNQKLIADTLRLIWKELKIHDSLASDFDRELQNKYDRYLKKMQDNYWNYADTVKSEAAFMATYLSMEFGKDYSALKSFVDKAALRFPDYKPVRVLKKESYEMINILTKELEIGDKIPVISLPSIENYTYSTANLKGHYYLLDVWAPWVLQDNVLKEQGWLLEKYASKNFEIVNIAFDEEKDKWIKIIKENNFKGIQLIDTDMWKGITAKTLLFDSIPFNFLVNPEGIILAKGIKQDSLDKVINSFVR